MEWPWFSVKIAFEKGAESMPPLPTAQPMTSTAEITSTTGTARKAAIALSVAGTGETADPKGKTQSGGPPWPCWWC